MSRDQNTGRSHSMKTENNNFGSAKELKYLGTISTNQNSIQGEPKSRLNLGHAFLSFGAESFVFQFAIQKFKD